MTRRHFEAAALIAADYPPAMRVLVADAFVRLFGQFNPRFAAARFYARVDELYASRIDQEGA